MAGLITLGVRAIGLLAPGLSGWLASVPVLRGEYPYTATDAPQPKPTLLPPSERRRTTAVTRLALAVAEEAIAAYPTIAGSLATVFASASGDLQIVDSICRSLQEIDRPISPTHFHNSVHNAPAGFWAIASQCTQGSLSLSAYDGSFAAGLLETGCLVASERAPVLLVAYDAAAPAPLAAKRPISAPFAVALLCAPAGDNAIATLTLNAATPGTSASQLAIAGLEALRCSNPAARCLPLLQAMAGDGASAVRLPGGWPQGLQVAVNR